VLIEGEAMLNLLGFIGLGQTELLILMFVILLLFGSAKLPSLMRNMGRSATEFKRGLSEPVVKSSVEEDEDDDEDGPSKDDKANDAD
jgi:sec-independent protein translocase protein TatA